MQQLDYRRAAMLAVLAVLALSCGGSGSTRTHTEASPQARPASVTPAVVTWMQPPCRALFARYRSALAAATGACRADADCARYGGVDPDNVCGGVTDAETARRLMQIGEDPARPACPIPSYSCPPIEPGCISGVCGGTS